MGDLDEEVREAGVIVALAARDDVFAVTEAAAGHDERDVAGAMGAGVATSNIPSIGKAKQSASQIFKIIDEISTLDVRDGHKSSAQHV